MARRKTPQIMAATLAAAALATVTYKIYDVLTAPKAETRLRSDKSIALTLSHSVLNSDLPLDEILSSSENVTFILPPYLSVDDLAGRIENGRTVYDLPQTMIKNYKLLRCSNLDGYFHLIKNLQPDMLFVCMDDLGVGRSFPADLRRFVKEIVTFGQDRSEVSATLSDVFMQK